MVKWFQGKGKKDKKDGRRDGSDRMTGIIGGQKDFFFQFFSYFLVNVIASLLKWKTIANVLCKS